MVSFYLGQVGLLQDASVRFARLRMVFVLDSVLDVKRDHQTFIAFVAFARLSKTSDLDDALRDSVRVADSLMWLIAVHRLVVLVALIDWKIWGDVVVIVVLVERMRRSRLLSGR